MKTLIYESPYTHEKEEVMFLIDKYSINNTLALEMICRDKDCGHIEPYTRVTVNLDTLPAIADAFIRDNMQCIDTNNNPGIDKWLEENGLATRTDMEFPSGYCVYPVMKFNLDKIREYEMTYDNGRFYSAVADADKQVNPTEKRIDEQEDMDR